MAIDLIKERVEIDNSSHSCITSCLAMLEGGAEIDLQYTSLPEGTTVLRAGHPVIMLASGKFAPCSISAGNYNTDSFGSLGNGSSVECIGVIAADVPVSAGYAPIMLAGVVDYDKSPIHLIDEFYTGLLYSKVVFIQRKATV